MAAEGRQTGFHNLIGDDGTEDRDQHRGEAEEIVIAHDVDMVGGVNEMGCCLGNAHQQGVQGTNEEIGREAAGHTGKGGGQTGHGMAAIGPEDHGAQGNQNDVARIGGHIGHDAQENHHRGNQPLGGHLDSAFQQGVNQARVLGHTHTQHGHQHHAQGGVAGKVFDGVAEDVGQTVFRQQTDGGDGGLFQLAVGYQFTGGRNAQGGADGGNEDDQQSQHGEQGHGVGQLIAHSLDAVEPTVVETDLVGRILVRHSLSPYNMGYPNFFQSGFSKGILTFS